MKPRIDDLIAFQIFKAFRPDELGDVANALNVIQLASGEALFKAGAPGNSMFFIFSGIIGIQLDTGENVAQLEAPTIFGEMAILDHKPRSASAIAVGKTVLWEMQETALNQMAEQGSPAAYKIMTWIAKGLSDKLRKTNETVHKLNAEVQKHAATSNF